MVELPRALNGPPGLCYWTAGEVVRRHGGNVVYGWQVVSLGAHIVMGLHHAVWRHPDGRIGDVTASLFAEPSSTITFVEDGGFTPRLDAPELVPNRYLFAEISEAQRLVAALTAELDAQRTLYARLLELGAKWTPGIGWTADPTLQAELAAELADLRRRSAEVDVARRAYAER